MTESKIRVLVVDDSSFMRKVISDILGTDPRMEVVGTARDGEDALRKIEELSPTVVTLDVEMPKKDGLATLEEIMKRRPLPVIMVSSLTQEGAQITLRALSAGAVDFVAKPSGHVSLNMRDVSADLLSKVLAASTARIVAPRDRREPRTQPPPSSPARPVESFASRWRKGRPEMVAIASSTGGPRALQQVLSQIPGDFPVPIVIVQHMPKDFTLSFAKRLDSLSELDVVEGAEGTELRPGLAVVAPGGYHMVVRKKTTGKFVCALSDAPPLLSVKPSANILFLSVADEIGGSTVGVILTGMGRDGADGAAALKMRGARIIAESQETCVVYGMPKAAVEQGVVDELLPLYSIPEAMIRSVRE
jgi:two-component system chemotaxis response regulator CheB